MGLSQSAQADQAAGLQSVLGDQSTGETQAGQPNNSNSNAPNTTNNAGSSTAPPAPPGAFPDTTLQPLPHAGYTGHAGHAPPPLPGIVLHPQPPAAAPTPSPRLPQINNPRSHLAQALSYFVPISTPDLTHVHCPDANSHPPSHIRLTGLYLTKKGIPPELVPRILNFAEYYTSCAWVNKRQVAVAAAVRPPRVGTAPPWRNGQEDDLAEILGTEETDLKDDEGKVWFLVTEPIGCAEVAYEEKVRRYEQERASAEKDWEVVEDERTEGRVWVRRMVVKTNSKDQGWSSSNNENYGTYEQSYTWFEVSLLRDGKEVEGSRTDFQHNVHAGQYYKEHINTFDPDHSFIKQAQKGDRVVLWVRAQYPGWRNNLREASITIWTSPYAP